jgi:hypothetical protein
MFNKSMYICWCKRYRLIKTHGKTHINSIKCVHTASYTLSKETNAFFSEILHTEILSDAHKLQ